jgi:drug/metabolite transporter (DMT)-like permease
MLLFVAANKLTTAANTIFLQSTAPLYLLLLAPWVLREPVQRRDLLFMASVAAGLVTILAGGQPALDSAPNPALGNAVAACSGVSWAFTLLGLRWASQAPRAELLPTALVAGNLLTFLVALPLAFPVERASAADGAIVAYLGVFQIGLAYVCLGAGVRRVSALEASLILLLEPALNPLWAWLLHGEAPGLRVLIGGVAILAATTVRTVVDARRRPES